jgi:TonB family protein
MADHSLSRLDSFDTNGPADVPTLVNRRDDDDDEGSGTWSSDLGSMLLEPGARTSPADLALDLVLNEIAQQARLASSATGAAIALARGSEIVCRATSGATAADVAVCLNTHSGISSFCLRSGRVQRCDDTETDSRVEVVACRRLGVRSILIVPVQKKGEQLGVIEIFSPRPHAFSDRDVLTLQACSKRVVANLDLAEQAITLTYTASLPTRPSADRPPLKFPKPRVGLYSVIRNVRASTGDWVPLLTLVVMTSALLVGWMLGHAGREPVTVESKVKSGTPSAAATSQTGPIRATSNVLVPVGQIAKENGPAPVPVPSPSNATSNAKNAPTQALAPPRASKAKRASDETSADGVVLYEEKGLASQIQQSQPSSESAKNPAAKTWVRDATTKESNVSTHPVLIPEEIANTHLVQRVEPQYPERAREQHIQGRVVLAVVVSEQGAVEGLGQVSGDPQLVLAAADAVRQWRFKPLLHNGQPVKFESRIMLDFVLP